MRELRVVPAVSLTVAPTTAVVPLAAATKRVGITVDVLNNRDAGSTGTVTLRVPQGWTVGARRGAVHVRPRGRARVVPLHRHDAVASRTGCTTCGPSRRLDGREYAEGFEEIDFRDLEVRYLYRPSTIGVRGHRRHRRCPA